MNTKVSASRHPASTDSVWGLLRRFIPHVPGRRRKQFIGLLFLMLVGALAEMVTIGAVIPFVSLLADPHAVLGFPRLQSAFLALGWDDPEAIATPMTLLFLVLVVSASVIRVLLLTVSTRYIYALGLDVSATLYRRILRQPYRFHVSQNSSELITAVNKVQTVLSSAVKPALDAMIALVLSIAILCILLYIQPVATVIAISMLTLTYTLIAWNVRRRLKDNGKRIAAAQTQRVSCIQEGLGGIRDTILDNSQDRSTRLFTSADRELRDSQARNSILNQLPQHLVQSIGMVLIIGFAWFLSGQSDGLTGALPMLGALALGAQRLLPMLQKLYAAWSRLTGSHQTFSDVLKFLELPDPSTDEAHPKNQLAFKHDIRLENIAFRYPQIREYVLRDINLTIPKGSRIGIFGPSGAGKSTLVDVIMGLLEPTEGHLLVDGVRVDACNRHLWGRQISHVPQDVFLLDATVAENIALGDGDDGIDMERVRKAARMAQIADFVESEPAGYRTRIGERGIQLSGGQRQRIALARAIYRNAEFIILDEATSALDSATEAAAMHALHRLEGRLTVLIIAHREQTLAYCDDVIRLESGTVHSLPRSQNVTIV